MRAPARLSSVLVAAALVTTGGCDLAPVVVAPPGRPVVKPAAGMEEAPPEARVLISVARSADDGAGLKVVSRYALLRRPAGEGDFAPFHYADAKTEETGRTLQFHDLSAVPGRPYEYEAYALAERERMTFGNVGAAPTRSPPSARVVASSPAGGVAPPGAPVAAPASLTARAPEDDDGHHLEIFFLPSPAEKEGRIRRYELLRATAAAGPFLPFPGNRFDPEGDGSTDERTETVTVPGAGPFWFRLFAVPLEGAASSVVTRESASPRADFFLGQRLSVAVVLVLFLLLSMLFLRKAQRGEKMFIRRIPGVDAIEEAVGRATEMGRPILYVPGIDEIQDIQTIASILILGRVSEMVARYDSEIRVPCCIPLVAAVSEEVVRQGFYDAGRPDAHRPQNVQWISSEQFAFCAGTNGIMLRDKPATNIFLGRFFAESLILAETGYVNRAIQIAGTAEITQLPFFIAACDYTLIGEELFAVSAYMTREPKLLSTLKAADWIKALALLLLLGGALAAVIAPESEGFRAFLEMLGGGG